MRSNRLARSLALCSAVTCAASGRAWATPTDPAPAAGADEDGQAARWMSAGNKAFREGRFAEAEEAYREAFALKRGYDIAGNLGVTELSQGKLREAAQHLAFTLRLFPLTGDPAVREQMQKAFDQCRHGVGTLRIKLDVRGSGPAPLAGSGAGSIILVDGITAGEVPLADPIFVEPGAHVVEAKLAGYAGAPERFLVEKGASLEVTLALTPEPPPFKAVATIAPVPHRSMVPGFALLGVAALGLGGGALFLSLSAGKRMDAVALDAIILGAHQNCVAGSPDYSSANCPALQRTVHADDAFHDVAVGSFIVGGAAAVAGAAYLLWPERAPSPSRELRVTPIMGAGNSGVLVSGSF